MFCGEFEATVSAASDESMWVPVRYETPGGAAIDPTGWVVEICIDPDLSPTSWHIATWDGFIVEDYDTYYLARVMFGVSPFDLTPGTYNVFVRLSTGAENPVRQAGTLTVV